MGKRSTYVGYLVALLVTGSAILSVSCKRDQAAAVEPDENMVTQTGDSLTIINSMNGRLKFKFETPLMEYYEQAKEPYREFRKGIYIESYNDSTGVVSSSLIGDYAINHINREFWEVKGNVVAVNEKGEKLETQQLFWNQKTKMIYSNVDSKVTQGETVVIGSGFESDEEFRKWEMRNADGRLLVDAEPNRDTARVSGPGPLPPSPADTTSSSATP